MPSPNTTSYVSQVRGSTVLLSAILTLLLSLAIGFPLQPAHSTAPGRPSSSSTLSNWSMARRARDQISLVASSHLPMISQPRAVTELMRSGPPLTPKESASRRSLTAARIASRWNPTITELRRTMNHVPDSELVLVPGGSLLTPTAEEGRALAITMARHSIHNIQPDLDVLIGGRPTYSTNPDSLIAVSQVIALEFATIAAANRYWRS